jgi:tetrahydromethanopterin S-methyltransferase subunit B
MQLRFPGKTGTIQEYTAGIIFVSLKKIREKINLRITSLYYDNKK